MNASAVIVDSPLRQAWTRWPGVQAGGLAVRSVNILFQVCLPSVVGSTLKPASPTPPRGGSPLGTSPRRGHTPSELPVVAKSRLAAPRACLTWRLRDFATNRHEYCGLAIGICAIWRTGCVSLTHRKSLCYGQPLSIRTVSEGFPLWRLKKI